MNKIQKYAEVRALIAKLEEEKKALEPEVIAEVMATGDKTVETELGKVTVSTSKKYTYTDAYYDQEKSLKEKAKKYTDQIKMLQLDEQESGVATVEETKSVSFKGNK